MGLVIAIVILGLVIAASAFFLIRSMLAPRRVDALHKMLKQRKTPAVIKAAKQLIAKDSRNADAHYILGLAYDQENKQELALMELKTVNQIGNFEGLVQEVPFRKKIAELYAKFNQPEEALKEYLLLLKRDPNNADYYVAVADIFEERNRSEKAVQYYRKAVELAPGNGKARAKLGLLLYRGKRPVEARAELEAAVRLQADNYEAWYYIGKILKDNKDCIAAMSALEKASRDPALKVKCLIERAGCLINTGHLDRAISELNRAASLADPSSNEALYARYFLAHCHEKLRHIEQAVEEWEAIYTVKPNFKDVAEKLSKYQELRTDDRVKDYLTVGEDEFVQMCKKITQTMGLTVRDAQTVRGGVDVTGAESTSKWRNARAMPKLIRFLRTADIVDESTVRSMLDDMKQQSVTRGVLVSSSTFSRLAQDYAESRPVDLFAKDKLQSLLQQIEL
ncbi:MAG: tetratricopeptide repeat protein [Spirochaetales bacterium]